MNFKLWSELNSKAKKELKPDFGFRNWNSLSEDEKYKIWKYLKTHFFNNRIKKEYQNDHYEFYGEGSEKELKERMILFSINFLNRSYKAQSYARKYLEDGTFNSACYDFYDIFMKQDEHVVIELLSLYCKVLISEKAEKTIYKREDETEEEYQKRLQNYRWGNFDKFSEDLNDVFTDFGINLYLTRQGFIPRQEEKIIKEIYEPVLSYLSHPKWEEVSKLLSDGFDEYRKNTPQAYSNCITNTISAVQAFLQIIVNGRTGKDEISKLITEGQKRNIIPNDFFTKKIFENIESIFARERQETGIAHPKKEYATEKNTRTILNLAMIFFQHCLQREN
jgi:hypothetical protein